MASSLDPAYNGLNPADVSATNTDNDTPPTKFYVVNDGSPDRTYEYGPTGSAVENYAINSGNTSPRGAASSAAGDKVWVVDANKKVYVYDTAGALLGSWTAGTLANNATVQGIATDGTDVWIIDARSDKVFRYANAAGRLSGTQTAASSFSLNSGNSGPKGIVTDGTYLWALNDSSTDKVFKYTLSGSLVGSWTITGAGSSPTGITLDPSGGVNHLWIVDSGTDRVYQFDDARSPHVGLAVPVDELRPGRRQHQPPGDRRPADADRERSSTRSHSRRVASVRQQGRAPSGEGSAPPSLEVDRAYVCSDHESTSIPLPGVTPNPSTLRASWRCRSVDSSIPTSALRRSESSSRSGLR